MSDDAAPQKKGAEEAPESEKPAKESGGEERSSAVGAPESEEPAKKKPETGKVKPLPPTDPPKSEFKIVRNAPVEEGTSPLLIVLFVVVALAAGGFYFYKQQKGDPAKPNNEPVPAPVVPDVEVPDFVSERLDFLEEEGNIEGANDYAEEMLETYPNKALKNRLLGYQRELGLIARPLSALIRDANKALFQEDYESARDLALDILDQKEDHPNGFFVRGICMAELDSDYQAAIEDLQAAIAAGFSPKVAAERKILEYEKR